ncbi:MAG: hypothetical protein ABGY75_06680, partial [Gemmataceae bacterium]
MGGRAGRHQQRHQQRHRRRADWIADVLGLTHDPIGESQTVTFTKRYAERHTGHSTWEGVGYDTFLRVRGNMSGLRRQRGVYRQPVGQ